ncbi:hypothetical protein L873DRAFT_482917 [Choiromyces venosus 120613-1]|uniref:Uncharacterized protein n=1 Tax=Choiromyces venosus 120613-1 TaxID=1336337 RepID=A0A3N4JUP4_9PEZI|nr:hypothetical protein L873DRAFT_482917 [Choiromyces venosus 120613-1]
MSLFQENGMNQLLQLQPGPINVQPLPSSKKKIQESLSSSVISRINLWILSKYGGQVNWLHQSFINLSYQGI